MIDGPTSAFRDEHVKGQIGDGCPEGTGPWVGQPGPQRWPRAPSPGLSAQLPASWVTSRRTETTANTRFGRMLPNDTALSPGCSVHPTSGGCALSPGLFLNVTASALPPSLGGRRAARGHELCLPWVSLPVSTLPLPSLSGGPEEKRGTGRAPAMRCPAGEWGWEAGGLGAREGDGSEAAAYGAERRSWFPPRGHGGDTHGDFCPSDRPRALSQGLGAGWRVG